MYNIYNAQHPACWTFPAPQIQAMFQIWIVLEPDPDLEQMFQIRLLI